MNSVFVNPGIHVLLMLFWKSLRIFFYHMYQIYVLGMTLQTCFSIFVHIIKSGVAIVTTISSFKNTRERLLILAVYYLKD